jgi:hypothetical protein
MAAIGVGLALIVVGLLKGFRDEPCGDGTGFLPATAKSSTIDLKLSDGTIHYPVDACTVSDVAPLTVIAYGATFLGLALIVLGAVVLVRSRMRT